MFKVSSLDSSRFLSLAPQFKILLIEPLVCSKKYKNVTHSNICLEKSSLTPQAFSKILGEVQKEYS